MNINSYTDLIEHLKNHKYTWIITGVAGFIGSHIAEELISLNQDIYGIDNFLTGSEDNISLLVEKNKLSKESNFIFKELDLSKKDSIKGIPSSDFLLHQAALGSVPRSIENPINTNNVNVNGFVNILWAAKASNIKRIIFAASSSTYGDSKALPKVEENIGSPLSPYAVTKYVNELYAEVFASLYGLELIGLRYFNVFGRKQDPNGAYAAAIPKFIKAFLNHESPIIHGDGSRRGR